MEEVKTRLEKESIKYVVDKYKITININDMIGNIVLTFNTKGKMKKTVYKIHIYSIKMKNTKFILNRKDEFDDINSLISEIQFLLKLKPNQLFRMILFNSQRIQLNEKSFIDVCTPTQNLIEILIKSNRADYTSDKNIINNNNHVSSLEQRDVLLSGQCLNNISSQKQRNYNDKKQKNRLNNLDDENISMLEGINTYSEHQIKKSNNRYMNNSKNLMLTPSKSVGELSSREKYINLYNEYNSISNNHNNDIINTSNSSDKMNVSWSDESDTSSIDQPTFLSDNISLHSQRDIPLYPQKGDNIQILDDEESINKLRDDILEACKKGYERKAEQNFVKLQRQLTDYINKIADRGVNSAIHQMKEVARQADVKYEKCTKLHNKDMFYYRIMLGFNILCVLIVLINFFY